MDSAARFSQSSADYIRGECRGSFPRNCSTSTPPPIILHSILSQKLYMCNSKLAFPATFYNVMHIHIPAQNIIFETLLLFSHTIQLICTH